MIKADKGAISHAPTAKKRGGPRPGHRLAAGEEPKLPQQVVAPQELNHRLPRLRDEDPGEDGKGDQDPGQQDVCLPPPAKQFGVGFSPPFPPLFPILQASGPPLPHRFNQSHPSFFWI